MHHPRHTLLATTGASPQVVTETLYAIHQQNQRWPDDIYLLTTSFGKDKAVQGLLTEQHLQRLCRELQRPIPAFDATHILVTPGADGNAVEDARSLQDHEALANFIMTEVRNRTADTSSSLHASLAGGRKTMTFYIGYAMSLFGRAQDTLSHVLVSEGYENIPGFWFPTSDAAHRHLAGKNATLDACDARVTLAPIPFVRHRRDVPQVLLQQGEAVNFAQLVQLINLGDNPDTVRLEVDLRALCIRLLDTSSNISITVTPNLIDLAFYAMMARATVLHENDILRPGKDLPDRSMAKMLVDELLAMCHKRPRGSLEDNLNTLKDVAGLKEKTLVKLEEGVTQSWFDQRKNTLSALLEHKLPPSLLRWVVPAIIWAEDGSRLPANEIDKTFKGGGYGLHLADSQIRLIEAQAN